MKIMKASCLKNCMCQVKNLFLLPWLKCVLKLPWAMGTLLIFRITDIVLN